MSDPRDPARKAADRLTAVRMRLPRASPQAKKLRRERNAYGARGQARPPRSRSEPSRADSGIEDILRIDAARAARYDARLRAIANLEKRLASAELQYAAAEQGIAGRSATPGEREWLGELWAAVEQRRAELAEYQAAMTAVPASAEHRGTKSYRPVPDRSGASGL